MSPPGKTPPLCGRTRYSLLRGLYTPDEYVSDAVSRGFSSAGITDINSFYGLVKFFQACKRQSVKPLVGVRLWLEGKERAVLFCLDRTGYQRAALIVSRILCAQAEYPFSVPTAPGLVRDRYDPVADLAENGWEGLVVASHDANVLSMLASRSTRNLKAALWYGRPFSSLTRLCRALSIRPLALYDSVYNSADQKKLYPLLRAIDCLVPTHKLPAEEILLPENCWPDEKSLSSFYSAVPEALIEAAAIEKQSRLEDLFDGPFIFPPFEGLTEPEAFNRLKNLCYKGLTFRYPKADKSVMDRLQYELQIVRSKGFSSYFLVVQDIVAQCPRTCGRGSSASSLVSYLLKITHVDPIRYNLFFERFLNEGRKDPPDIDVDFPWDERNKALSYVFTKYRGRAAMVADHVTFADRSAFRDPAKAFGLDPEEVDRIMYLKSHGRIEDLPPYLLKAASGVRGFVRYIGCHPGGVVITPSAITDYSTVQPTAQGYPVLAWEKDATEDAGLVKIDLLGNRSLGVLRDCYTLLNSTKGTDFQWHDPPPLDDPAIAKDLEQGNSLGVFYVESPATRQLLGKMRHGTYEHLVVASSIVRPAANRFIKLYLERLHGKTWTAPHPLLASTLKETLGVMVYQEDVSRVVMDLCGFDCVKADILRKVLSRKDRELRLKDLYRDYREGGLKNLVREDVLKIVWEMILSFDGYSFCKAHSASYALVSYRLMEIKRRYPLEFFACVINNGGGFYSRQVYLDEVRRLGFVLLGPDVNKSASEYRVEEGALRMGLSQIVDVSSSVMNRIAKGRQADGPFTGFSDFLERIAPDKGSLRALIKSGALDGCAAPLNRPAMFWSAAVHRPGKELIEFNPVPPGLSDYSRGARLSDEKEFLGLLYSVHPLEVFRPRIDAACSLEDLFDSRNIRKRTGQKILIAGSVVTGKQVWTKDKKTMCFVSFEDQYSVFETVFFPQCYNKFAPSLADNTAFLISGRVEEDFGMPIIEVSELFPLNRGSCKTVPYAAV